MLLVSLQLFQQQQQQQQQLYHILSRFAYICMRYVRVVQKAPGHRIINATFLSYIVLKCSNEMRFLSNYIECQQCPTSWKKRRLVVEVESFASSWKKYDASTRRRIGVVVEKNEESRRTFNKNSCDLLTEITHTEILVARCIFLIGGLIRDDLRHVYTIR